MIHRAANHHLRRAPWVLWRCAPWALWACVLGACDGETTAPAAEPPGASAPAAEAPTAEPKPVPKADPIDVQGGLNKPESALHDPVADVYLVSNVVGKALEADGEAFISRIAPSGEILALRWIEGGKGGVKLNAPKGMAIAGDSLYVADIDTVRIFDRESGKPSGDVVIKGATFLNDVAANASGQVFVSDSGLELWGPYMEPNGKDAIYRIEGKQAVPVIEGKALGNPNGLLATGGALHVVNKGGELYRVDGGSKQLAVKLPKGSLDGIVETPQGLVISSWDAKAVFLQKGDRFVPIAGKLSSPADLGYDAKRNRLLIPLFNDKTLRIQPL